ncbi:MAG: trigger factor, partial [Actinomycetota bacterium]|nr:trigger factor [Actinomycetota bacterium]
MQTTVETLNPTRVRLTVEVPFAELEPAVSAAYKRIAQQVRVQGFRPGKVPPRIIDQRIGRGAVLDEALQSALPELYSSAVRDNEVAVLSQPEVDVTELVDGQRLVFTAEVDVRPTVELPAYDSLTASVDDVEVTDEEVDEQLAGLQDRFSTLTGVERPVQDGDFVSLDLVATIDGEAVPGGEATGLSYEAGSGTMLPGLDDAIRGLSAGEDATFDSELVAGEHAGKTAQVKVTVRSVKVKEVPGLDDDFAQTASEFDTIAELRADTRGRLERARRLEQGVEARDAVLEALLERVDVPAPSSAVDAEVAWRRQSIEAQLQQAGLTMESYLESEERTASDIESEMREAAETAVKAQLVLDAVADAEQIGVNDAELTEQVVRRAQGAGMSAEQYAQQVMQNQQLGALVAEVRRGKALAHLLEVATVTDASGRPVDMESIAQETSGEAVDESGRRYHTHADGTIHYLDDQPTGGPAEQVDDAGRRFHTHDDGTVHYLDDEPAPAGPSPTDVGVPAGGDPAGGHVPAPDDPV